MVNAYRAKGDQGWLHEQWPAANTLGQHYYVELPLALLDDQGHLIDSLIRYSFDTLHVQHLDLRIVTEPAHQV